MFTDSKQAHSSSRKAPKPKENQYPRPLNKTTKANIKTNLSIELSNTMF